MAMLWKADEYFAEKNAAHERARLMRIANEPCWVEHLAVVAWAPTRAMLRGVGYALLVGGHGLLRVTQPKQTRPQGAQLMGARQTLNPMLNK
jgi:hypothetical protein